MSKTLCKNTRRKIYSKYDGHCAYCGKLLNEKYFQVDHIEPKFRKTTDKQLLSIKRVRGENEMNNYNPCCKSCNCSKSTYTLKKWRNEINLKHQRLLKSEPSYNLLFRFKMIKKVAVCKFYFETL